VDLSPAVQQMRRDLEGWEAHLSQSKIERTAAEAALMSMTEKVATRLDAYKRKADIPEDIFRQMRTCQTAANEFLRQFWAAIYPPVGETLGGPTTLAQKTAKATRMAGYLIKTPEKVAAIIKAADMAGVDRGRVQTVCLSALSFLAVVDLIIKYFQGMQPTMDTVSKALEFWETRKAASGPGAPGARKP
jgi:transcription initiation factor TFIIH subunit 1